MDKFYVIRNNSVVMDWYVSEEAAINAINAETGKPGTDGNTYQVAQVIATSRAQRIWNRP